MKAETITMTAAEFATRTETTVESWGIGEDDLVVLFEDGRAQVDLSGNIVVLTDGVADELVAACRRAYAAEMGADEDALLRVVLTSCKGGRALVGTRAEVVEAAVAFLLEHQPAFGITLSIEGAASGDDADPEWGDDDEANEAAARAAVAEALGWALDVARTRART